MDIVNIMPEGKKLNLAGQREGTFYIRSVIHTTYCSALHLTLA